MASGRGFESSNRWSVIVGLVVAVALAAPSTGVEVAVRERINAGLGTPPPMVQRSTPEASWTSFLQLTREGEPAFAAHLLDLSEVVPEKQREVGREVARKLGRVLQRLDAGPGAVASAEPAGPREDGQPLNYVVAARFQEDEVAGEVWLRRTRDESTGEEAWLFTRRTVSDVATCIA